MTNHEQLQERSSAPARRVMSASGILFAVLISIPAVAHWRLGLGAVPALWLAYVVTRPLGASFADWGGVSHARGGLDLGTGTVSLALTVLIVGFVGYLAVTRKDVNGPGLATESADTSTTV